MRRHKWSTGLELEDFGEEGIPYRPVIPDPAAENDDSPFGATRRMRDHYQE